MKYRVAAVFLGAWLLVALVSVLTAGGGHPPAGPVLWVVANYFTLGGRIAREIYGPVVTDLLFSRLGFVLSLIEVAVVGLGIGLVLEAGAQRRPQRTLGASILLVYIVAHILVAPVGASRTALAYRLRSARQSVYQPAFTRISQGKDPADIDVLVRLIPTLANQLEPHEVSGPVKPLIVIDTFLKLKGIDFWSDYLHGQSGRASSADFCERVLFRSEIYAYNGCDLPRQAVSKQLDTLTVEVAACFARELAGGRCEVEKLALLAKDFPWVADAYRDLLLEKLTDPARPQSFLSTGAVVPDDPNDPCYVADDRRRWLIGGGVPREMPREQLASVLDYWRVCPAKRSIRTLSSSCK